MIDVGVDVQSANRYDETALYGASRWNHVDCVQLLLKHGASVEKKTQRGWTALGAAVYENCPAVVEILLNAGARPDAGHGSLVSLLTLAAKNGKMVIMSSLLAAQADPNGWREAVSLKGERTPIGWACYRGTIRMVRALLEAGAKPDIRAAYTAPNTSQDEMVKLMREYENSQQHLGNTPSSESFDTANRYQGMMTDIPYP